MLYNAINGSDYQNPDELEIYTMENFVYMGIKNDLSFLIQDDLNIYEHQSTPNLNMPYSLIPSAVIKKMVWDCPMQSIGQVMNVFKMVF